MSQYKADTDVLKAEQVKLRKEHYSADNKRKYEIGVRLRQIHMELIFKSKGERVK